MAWSPTRLFSIAFVMTTVAAIFLSPVADAQAHTFAQAGAGAGDAVRTHTFVSAQAERLSGRALTVVCAASAQEWAQGLTEVGLPGAADEYYGFSLVQRGEMRLSPYVCEGLRLGGATSTLRSNEMQVAWSVDVLIHEGVHLGRLSVDEKVAEACARIALPSELNRLYGVRYGSAQMRRMVSAAAWFRGAMPLAYQGGTCPAPGE